MLKQSTSWQKFKYGFFGLIFIASIILLVLIILALGLDFILKLQSSTKMPMEKLLSMVAAIFAAGMLCFAYDRRTLHREQIFKQFDRPKIVMYIIEEEGLLKAYLENLGTDVAYRVRLRVIKPTIAVNFKGNHFETDYLLINRRVEINQGLLAEFLKTSLQTTKIHVSIRYVNSMKAPQKVELVTTINSRE